jgi:hypothetical protein
MADIVHRIPWQLSNFLPGTPNSGGYALQSYAFDYALGGIPFLSATRDQWPYSEGMAEIRKQQFDSSAEPGEQSIYGWWLRSQNSWTSGAGLLYQDPDVVNPYTRSFDLRFDDSLGIDNWTPGQLTLLKQPVSRYSVGNSFTRVRGYVDPSGVDAAFYMDGNTLYKMTDAGRTAITTSSAGTALGLANAGSTWFLLATDGIWRGVDTGAGVKIWNNPAGTLTTGTIEVVKQRLVAGWNNALYILDLNGTSAGAPALPATWAGGIGLVMLHPDSTWAWTCSTEGPSAIYASGHNGTDSSIYRFVSDLSSTTEVFIPIVTAQLPRGELVRTIYSYVGTYVGIATNKGFRVGELDQGGDISYGPLLFQPTGGCQGLVGFDRFMYVGSTNAHDGATGVFRVDLGAAYQEASTNVLRYAYARDIYAPNQTGTVASVSIFGASGRVVFSISTNSIWLQSATELYTSGYIQTGRIRYNTEEPKLYKFMSVSAPDPLLGNLSVSIIDIQGVEHQSLTYTPALNPGTSDITISQPAGRQKWIKLKFTLSRGADTAKGAVLNGWQVKALPGSIRQRMINHTFLLFDEEMDKSGQRIGTDGYARSRFEAFKELAREGDVVVFQELMEDRSVLVVIDDWKFTQLAPPGPGGSALGGYLTVVLRTVAESV